MRKIRLIFVPITILLIQTLGCDRNLNASLPPFTPTVLPLTAVYGIMPTRYEDSENTISMSVQVKGIKFTKQTDKSVDSRSLQLIAHFKNVSTNPIVFRRPITYGFVGVNSCANDIEIMIEKKNGPQMNVTANSNYPCGYESVPSPEVSPEDFLEIEPGDVFSYPIEIALPGVLIKTPKYIGELPPGTYKLKVEYKNLDIGYELPLDITPPARFENSQAELEWYDNNTLVVDLKAWVGSVISNEVDVMILADR